jgi:hypothetical protein
MIRGSLGAHPLHANVKRTTVNQAVGSVSSRSMRRSEMSHMTTTRTYSVQAI